MLAYVIFFLYLCSRLCVPARTGVLATRINKECKQAKKSANK